MTLKIDGMHSIRTYYSGGTLLGAMQALCADIRSGTVGEVFIDHVYSENTNRNGWTVSAVYRGPEHIIPVRKKKNG